MNERPGKTQKPKRETMRPKREVTMAESEKPSGKQTNARAKTRRPMATTKPEAAKSGAAKVSAPNRKHETQVSKQKPASANKVTGKSKTNQAPRASTSRKTTTTVTHNQSQQSGVKAEMETGKGKSGQPEWLSGAAATSETASKSDDSAKQSPNTEQKNGKDTSTMTEPNDTTIETHITRYEQAKTEHRSQNRLKANQIVSTYSAIGAGVGIIPVAVVDIAGLATVQLMMLSRLADNYGVKFSGNVGRTVVSAILGSVVPTTLKSGTIGLIRSVPIFGPLFGLAAMPAYSWMVTYAIGTVFTDIFEQSGDIGSLSPEETSAKIKAVMKSVATKEAAAAATGAAPAQAAA